MKKEQKFTSRGFSYIEFEDLYGEKFTLQKSSLATEDAVWLGIANPDPKIMANKADFFGIKTDQENGWIPYPIPKDVLINTSMHLSRDQVKELIPILQEFVDSGEVYLEEENNEK